MSEIGGLNKRVELQKTVKRMKCDLHALLREFDSVYPHHLLFERYRNEVIRDAYDVIDALSELERTLLLLAISIYTPLDGRVETRKILKK